MEKSDSDIPRVDLYRKTIVFDKQIQKNIQKKQNFKKTL